MARDTNRDSVGYIAFFAACVCLVCAVLVSSAVVVLRPLQAENRRVDRLGRVLEVADLIGPDESPSAEEIVRRFEQHIAPRVVELKTGEYVPDVDPQDFDQRRAARDPEHSRPAPANPARVARLPDRGVVYHVMKGEQIGAFILPIQGYGLWSTLYGYLALEADANTVAGITFYEHGETPGLGGEIENPRWQALWRGRQVFDAEGRVRLQVIKGHAGRPAEDPFRVDSISGATITARGVAHTIAFWLGPDGFGPYLERYRAQTRQGSTP
jgi:Na+-transporting NADH:ubiquinone oxidoreductase subunit C